jgi:hypothetical protein
MLFHDFLTSTLFFTWFKPPSTMSDTFYTRLVNILVKLAATLAFLEFMDFFYHVEVRLNRIDPMAPHMIVYNYSIDIIKLHYTLSGEKYFLLYPFVLPFILLVDQRKTILKGIALFLILLWELFLISIFL